MDPNEQIKWLIRDDGLLRMVPERACEVSLDARFYKRIGDFEARFPHGVPSIRGAESLSVEGDWTFGAGVVATGDAHLGRSKQHF